MPSHQWILNSLYTSETIRWIAMTFEWNLVTRRLFLSEFIWDLD